MQKPPDPLSPRRTVIDGPPRDPTPSVLTNDARHYVDWAREAFVHRGADRNLIAHAHIDTRDRNRPSFAAAHNCLPQNVDTIRRQKCCSFDLVDDGISGAMARCFASDCIDTAVGTTVVGTRHQLVVDISLRKIDRLGATRLGHCKPLRHLVDGNDSARSHHDCRPDRKLTHGPAAPDGYSVSIFDLSVFSGHVTCREDIGQK